MRLAPWAWALPLALAVLACASLPPSGAPDDTLLLPGERAGPVTRHTTREALAALYGEGALRDGDVGLGEDFQAPGTRVLEGTPRAFTVVWADASRRAPLEVRELGPAWKTPEGLGVGTPFAELEHVLGPFRMAGFEWDYPGTVSLEGTRLARYRDVLGLQLAPRDEAALETADYRAVLGSSLYASSDPHLRTLGLEVHVLVVRLVPEEPPR